MKHQHLKNKGYKCIWFLKSYCAQIFTIISQIFIKLHKASRLKKFNLKMLKNLEQLQTSILGNLKLLQNQHIIMANHACNQVYHYDLNNNHRKTYKCFILGNENVACTPPRPFNCSLFISVFSIWLKNLEQWLVFIPSTNIVQLTIILDFLTTLFKASSFIMNFECNIYTFPLHIDHISLQL